MARPIKEEQQKMKYTIVSYDEEGEEADVLISLPSGEFLCYFQPCDFELLNRSKHLKFSVLFAEEIKTCLEKTCSFQKTELGYFSYKVSGIVKDKYLVMVDECLFDLDTPVPGDVGPGDYVEFECSRIDL